MRAYHFGAEYVGYDVRGSYHVRYAFRGRRENKTSRVVTYTGGCARSVTYRNRTLPAPSPYGISRSVGVSARGGVSTYSVVLRARKRRSFRRGTVQFPPEIPVFTVRRKRFHFQRDRRRIRVRRQRACNRRLRNTHFPHSTYREKCARPIRLLSQRRNRRHNRDSDGDKRSGRKRVDTAYGTAVAVRQFRQQFPHRFLRFRRLCFFR